MLDSPSGMPFILTFVIGFIALSFLLWIIAIDIWLIKKIINKFFKNNK